MEFVELASETELRSGFEVMRELRDHLTEEDFVQQVKEMAEDGYRLFALRADGEIVAVAGIALRRNLYYGKYLWVYDLVTKAGRRSRGHGEALLRHLEDLARREGCDVIALSSGVQRTDAHRFYETRMGYERASYVYKNDLG